MSLSLGLQGQNPRIHEPAVAGLFYPADPVALGAFVESSLTKSPKQDLPILRALICPHAGYPYSGPTAALAYKQIQGRALETVFLLGPSHTAAFNGAALLDAGQIRTPLGLLTVSPLLAALKDHAPFTFHPDSQIHRPAWAKARTSPETPFTWEHSLEVQFPFLQKVLPGVPVAPILLGHVDPQAVGRVLNQIWKDRYLLIASSDLSHFHTADQAQLLDKSCIQAVLDGDMDKVSRAEACGKLPILALMHLARARGWKARLLEYTHSGHRTGENHSVVGYAAIAFYEEKAPK